MDNKKRIIKCEYDVVAIPLSVGVGLIVGDGLMVGVIDGVGLIVGVIDGVGVSVGVIDVVGVADGVGRIQVIGSRPKMSVALCPARASVISPVVTNRSATGSKISALESGL